MTLCGRFLFWKSCAEKIQQNVAVERENQIVSIKKSSNQPTHSEEGRRPRVGGSRSPPGSWPASGGYGCFPEYFAEKDGVAAALPETPRWSSLGLEAVPTHSPTRSIVPVL